MPPPSSARIRLGPGAIGRSSMAIQSSRFPVTLQIYGVEATEISQGPRLPPSKGVGSVRLPTQASGNRAQANIRSSVGMSTRQMCECGGKDGWLECPTLSRGKVVVAGAIRLISVSRVSSVTPTGSPGGDGTNHLCGLMRSADSAGTADTRVTDPPLGGPRSVDTADTSPTSPIS
jgi:hypothetical protein